MKKAITITLIILPFWGFVNQDSSKTWKRYNIESGILKFKYTLIGLPSEGIIYFGNYGVNERIEMKSTVRTFTILKIEGKQYLMVTDSMAITQDRENEFLWEKYNPQISNSKEIDVFTNFQFLEVVQYLNLPSKKHSCFNNFDSYKIKTEITEWNNVPLKIISGSIQEGYLETFDVTEIDTLTSIPEILLTLQSYVDTGE